MKEETKHIAKIMRNIQECLPKLFPMAPSLGEEFTQLTLPSTKKRYGGSRNNVLKMNLNARKNVVKRNMRIGSQNSTCR